MPDGVTLHPRPRPFAWFFSLFLPPAFHVRIYEDRFVISVVDRPGAPISVSAERPFSGKRLLIADLASAVATLKRAVAQAGGSRWNPLKPAFIVQPLKRFEDDFSPVEVQSFMKLVEAVGAREIMLLTAPLPELTAAQASAFANGALEFDP